MGEDSKELTEEDFDFSGAFKMSEPLPGAKSEKGRSITNEYKDAGVFYIIHGSLFKSIQCTDLFDAGIHILYQYMYVIGIFIWFWGMKYDLPKFISYM